MKTNSRQQMIGCHSCGNKFSRGTKWKIYRAPALFPLRKSYRFYNNRVPSILSEFSVIYHGINFFSEADRWTQQGTGGFHRQQTGGREGRGCCTLGRRTEWGCATRGVLVTLNREWLPVPSFILLYVKTW